MGRLFVVPFYGDRVSFCCYKDGWTSGRMCVSIRMYHIAYTLHHYFCVSHASWNLQTQVCIYKLQLDSSACIIYLLMVVIRRH